MKRNPAEEAQLSIQLEALRQQMYEEVDKRVEEVRDLIDKGQLPDDFQLPREGLGAVVQNTGIGQEDINPKANRYDIQKILQERTAERKRLKPFVFRAVGEYPVGGEFTLQELAEDVGASNFTFVAKILSANYDVLGVKRVQGTQTYRKIGGARKKLMSQDMQAFQNIREAVLKYPVGSKFTAQKLVDITGYNRHSMAINLFDRQDNSEVGLRRIFDNKTATTVYVRVS